MNKSRKNAKNRLRKASKIEAKKPLFSATEHGSSSTTPTESFSISFTKLLTSSSQ